MTKRPSEDVTEALLEGLPRIPLVQPTPEEIRNGWTAESLTAYLNERQGQKAKFAFQQKKPRVLRVENHLGFHPHDW